MSLNRVLILGNLGADPKMNRAGAHTVVNFSVGTSEYVKDGPKKTEWHNIVAWNKTAENCGKYLRKGSTVLVEGRLQTRSWDDKTSGQKRYATEIVAQNVQFVGKPPADGASHAARGPVAPPIEDGIPF